MDKWEYQVVLVDKWGRAMRRDSALESGVWQFDEKKSSDLVSLLSELGAEGWDLITVDPNKSYAEGNHGYVGSLYIFQRVLNT
jgi:hypothetical protein